MGTWGIFQSYHPSSHNHGSVKIGLPPIVPLFKYSQTFHHDGRFSIVFPVIFVKTLYLYLSHRQGQTLRCHTCPLSSWHLCRYLPEAKVEKQPGMYKKTYVKSGRIYLFTGAGFLLLYHLILIWLVLFHYPVIWFELFLTHSKLLLSCYNARKGCRELYK